MFRLDDGQSARLSDIRWRGQGLCCFFKENCFSFYYSVKAFSVYLQAEELSLCLSRQGSKQRKKKCRRRQRRPHTRLLSLPLYLGCCFFLILCAFPSYVEMRSRRFDRYWYGCSPGGIFVSTRRLRFAKSSSRVILTEVV